MNPFGITERSFQLLCTALKKYPAIKQVVVYGSRAMGNYKKGSDIDLALVGDISDDDYSKIHYELSEVLPIPYHVDVLHYDALSNVKLKAHIDQHGKPLYSE